MAGNYVDRSVFSDRFRCRWRYMDLRFVREKLLAVLVILVAFIGSADAQLVPLIPGQRLEITIQDGQNTETIGWEFTLYADVNGAFVQLGDPVEASSDVEDSGYGRVARGADWYRLGRGPGISHDLCPMPIELEWEFDFPPDGTRCLRLAVDGRALGGVDIRREYILPWFDFDGDGDNDFYQQRYATLDVNSDVNSIRVKQELAQLEAAGRGVWTVDDELGLNNNNGGGGVPPVIVPPDTPGTPLGPQDGFGPEVPEGFQPMDPGPDAPQLDIPGNDEPLGPQDGFGPEVPEGFQPMEPGPDAPQLDIPGEELPAPGGLPEGGDFPSGGDPLDPETGDPRPPTGGGPELVPEPEIPELIPEPEEPRPPTGGGDPPPEEGGSSDLSLPIPEFDWSPVTDQLDALRAKLQSRFDIQVLSFDAPEDIGPLRVPLPLIGSLDVPVLPSHLSNAGLADAADFVVELFHSLVLGVVYVFGFLRIFRGFKELA